MMFFHKLFYEIDHQDFADREPTFYHVHDELKLMQCAWFQSKQLCVTMDHDYIPLHFYDHPIEVIFNRSLIRRKTPPCPDGFVWNGRVYKVTGSIAEWVDFSRRGRMARNMRPAHADVASRRGSLGVGRFYFRIQASLEKLPKSQRGKPVTWVFDIYYDREIKDSDDRGGHWYLYRELSVAAPS